MDSTTTAPNPEKVLDELELREKQESSVNVSQAHKILEKLSLKPENLPTKTKEELKLLSKYKEYTGVKNLDVTNVLQWYTSHTINKTIEEDEMLKLKQKNEELDLVIHNNNIEIDRMRKELDTLKSNMEKSAVNPENISSQIGLINQKVQSYEANYEINMQKFMKLKVPAELHPKSLQNLIDELKQLREKEYKLKEIADNCLLARSAKETLLKLRKD